MWILNGYISMTKTSFLLALFSSFLLLTTPSCTKSTKNGKPSHQAKSHVFRVNFVGGDMASIHPHIGIDIRVRSVQTALFEGLTRINPQGIPEPAAAEAIDLSPCGKVYTFHIRPAYWSNGKRVTAHHFESAWKAALSPNSPCMRADLFYVIKNAQEAKKGLVPVDSTGILAIDDQTLRIELSNPAPYFLDLIANPMFSPLYAIEDKPSVFNGPFIIGAREYDKYCQLIANPSYWDAQHVGLKEVDISFITDSQTALALFEKGELDWIGTPFSGIPLESIPALREKERLNVKEVARVFWIYCNTEVFPFQSANIRKALSFAINREAIADHILEGQSPVRAPLPACLSLLDEEKRLPLQGDPELAREYFRKGLQELGLTAETFPPITLSHFHIAGQKPVAEAIQSYWTKELGIQVQIVGSEWNVFFSDLCRGQYQLGGCFKSAFFKDPIYHLELLKEKQHVYNVSRWENPLYRQLLDQATVIGQETVRNDLLKQAETILMDEMPVIPLYSEQYQYVVRPEVKGVYVQDLGHVDFKWIDVIR